MCIYCGDIYTWYGGYLHSYRTVYEQFSRTEHMARTICSKCGSNPSSSFEAHVDNNSDNTCDRCGFEFYPDPAAANLRVSAYGNGVNSCTGYLDLTWDAVADATTYYVAIFNGSVYDYFPVGNVTSWSTKGKGIWPTDEEISSGRYELHTDGSGTELNMIPALSYRNAGTVYASDLNYYVSVIPANDKGYASQPPKMLSERCAFLIRCHHLRQALC